MEENDGSSHDRGLEVFEHIAIPIEEATLAGFTDIYRIIMKKQGTPVEKLEALWNLDAQLLEATREV